MEEVSREVEDPGTHEVRTETELAGTNIFQIKFCISYWFLYILSMR